MKPTLLSSVAVLALMGCAAASFAQAGASSTQTVIYGGQPLDEIGAHATSWGGGIASDHNGDAFTTAGHAVNIKTAGLYQGGVIKFDNPVSLGDLKADPTRYLQIIYSADKSSKYTSQTTTQFSAMQQQNYNFGGAGGAAGLPGSNMNPHFKFLAGSFQIAQDPFKSRNGPPPGFGFPGAGAPRGVPTSPGNPAQPGGTIADTSGVPNLPINQLHVILVFADGSQAEMVRPVSLSQGDDITWLRAGIALSAIPISGSSASNAQLKKILIGTDVPADLNIGEIRLVNDNTAITADAGKSQTAPAGSSVSFVGTGEGGASALKYEWSFESTAGFVSQAEGVKVSHVFTKPGDYTVTLKVSDVDGIKQPATANVVVHINDQGPVANPNPLLGGPNRIPNGGRGGPPPGFFLNQ